MEEALRALPGPAFEHTQGVDESGVPAELPVEPGALDAAFAVSAAACTGGRLPPVLVVFAGGVTATEVSALRFLGRSEAEGGAGRHFVVLASSMVSGDGVLSALSVGGE